MPTRERPADRGVRIARNDVLRVCSDIHLARIAAGLSLVEVGRSVGLSRAHVSRVERAAVPSISVARLAAIGAVVGLDIRLRAYPGPDPIRDVAQFRLLERLRRRCHPGIRFRTEVPLHDPGDQRAWDARIGPLRDRAGGVRDLPIEAETRLTDLQAQLRRLQLKMRDGGEDCVLLLLADTRRNRHVIRTAQSMLAPMFPVPARRALASLAAGAHPGGSALVCV